MRSRVSVARIVAPPLSRCEDKRRKVNRGEREEKRDKQVRDERAILEKETDFRAALALEEGRRVKRSGMHILAKRGGARAI